MKITEQAGVCIIEHNGLAMQLMPEELRQLRGMTSVELRTHFRMCLTPNAGRKERKALAEIAKDIDQLSAALEEFFSRNEDSSSSNDGDL